MQQRTDEKKRIAGTGRLSSEWLREASADVGDPAFCLVQGYAATAFCLVRSDAILWPPNVEPEQDPEEWRLAWDFRLFGDRGEWHGWRDGAGVWRARFAAAGQWADADVIRRKFFLRGAVRKKWTEEAPDNRREKDGVEWAEFVEGTGTELWLPAAVAPGKQPPRLTIGEWVQQAAETGLARIVDARIMGFVTEGAK